MNLFNVLGRLFVLFMDFFSLQKILVLGDSHVKIFIYPLMKLYFPLTKFEVVSVGGATASGLENPNSKTQAYKIFSEKLQSKKKYDKIIIMLGEVDTGFVIWYRAKKYGKAVKEMFNMAVKKYTNFINKAANYGELIVISTPLPTIGDDNNWGEVANLRKEVKVTQIERTKLTIEFNKEIELFCKKNNIVFLNLDNESLGPDGLVKKELLNKNKFDHHYNKSSYAKLINLHLKQLI